MTANVEIVEGGKLLGIEKMKLKKVKEFSDGSVIFENEDGRAVLYSPKKSKYTLISIDMA
jgi:hypothetical protein